MADWTELDTNGLLPGEPFTSAKALAFFENPTAMAEGAVNAPKVVSGALDMLVGAGTTTTSFTNLERVDNVLISAGVSADPGTGGSARATAVYELSTNNGSSWGTPVTIVTARSSEQVKSRTGFAVVGLGSSNNAIRIRNTGSGASGGVSTFTFSILGVSGVSP